MTLYTALTLHALKVPLGVLPLRLARRQQVSHAFLFISNSSINLRQRRACTYRVCFVLVALKLCACKLERLFACGRVADLARAADNGTVEADDAGPLDKELEVQRGLLPQAGRRRGRSSTGAGLGAGFRGRGKGHPSSRPQAEHGGYLYREPMEIDLSNRDWRERGLAHHAAGISDAVIGGPKR